MPVDIIRSAVSELEVILPKIKDLALLRVELLEELDVLALRIIEVMNSSKGHNK